MAEELDEFATAKVPIDPQNSKSALSRLRPLDLRPTRSVNEANGLQSPLTHRVRIENATLTNDEIHTPLAHAPSSLMEPS